MTKILFAMALAACGGGNKSGASSTPPPASSGPDCEAAISHSLELSKADMVKMGADDKALATMHTVGVQHCKDDKWPDDVLACMVGAKAEADAQACYGKLSAEQQESMNKAMGAK